MVRPVAAFWLLLALAYSVPAQEAERLSALRNEALAAVNDDRKQHGLPPLRQTDALNRAAQAHAEDMLARDYYSHTSPEGASVADRYQQQGGSRWHFVAENIARCGGCPVPPTAERVRRFEQGWMESPKHRENILRHGLSGFGFGIAGSEDQPLYAVQTFAGPGTPRGVESAAATEVLSPEQQTERVLRRINTARRKADVPPLRSSRALSEAARALITNDPEHIVDPQRAVDLFNVLPPDQRREWRTLRLAAGRCGGCGELATAADVDSFAERWVEQDGTRETLLSKNLDGLGFAMKVRGDGMKSAVLLLAQQR